MNRMLTRRSAALAASLALACALPAWADRSDDAACAAITTAVAASGNSVCVSIRDGVATLSGDVDSSMDRREAERVALETDGVERVVNLLTVND